VGGDTKLVAAFVAAVYEELNASRGGAEEAFR
jgi:hypothetical protein